MVNRVQSNWNDLVNDFYRVKSIITVLYSINYIPDLTRTEEYNPKHNNPDDEKIALSMLKFF